MLKLDRLTKILMFWIAVMLTIIVVKTVLPEHILMAQESNTLSPGPVEVIIKEPVAVRVIDWDANPSQPFKVKIDDPWPARVEIRDEIKVKGELRMQN